MNIITRITSYAVLPLCLFAAAMWPSATVAASVVPHAPVPARFFSILPAPAVFAMQDPAPPEGKGKDETVKLCTTCHAANLWVGQRHTRDEWSGVIDAMISKGLEATDEQLEVVNNYLSTYLAAPKKDADSKK